MAQGAASSKTGAAAKTPRTWTDSTGQFKIRAVLVAVEGEEIVLKRSDTAAELRIALEKLSEADRNWVAKNAAAAKGEASRGLAAGEWPWWRGPNYDARSTDKGLLKEWPKEGPNLLWKKSGIGRGFSSAVVSHGTVYITGEKGGQLKIFAYDLNGKERWQADHGPEWTKNYPGSRGSPSVDGDNLYLLSGNGVLACFNTANGKRKWEASASQFGGSPGGWGYAESPLVWGNLVIFKPGGKNFAVALDKSSGRQVWTSQGFASGPEYSSCLPIFLDGVSMLVTGSKSGLVCFNAKNGAMLWGDKFSENNIANCPTPSYSDGYVFWANGYGKGGICMKLARGGKAAEAWTTRDLVCHHGGYVIDNGYIYGNNESGCVCLELKTGKKMWQEKAVGKGSVCWADGMLYLFGERDGRGALATCSPSGLEVTGHVKVDGDGPSWAHPVVIGGRFYLRYDDNLYCFDVKAK